MDQLSSCYFCGGALDVSLSEYPVIPKSLEPDAAEQGTVVLCSTCREKLARIVEPVVEAATADAGETAGTAGEEPPGLLDDTGTPTADGPTTDSVATPTDDGSLLGDDTAAEREASELSADEFQQHPASSSGQSSESADPGANDQQSPTEADRAESDAAETDTDSADSGAADDSDDPSLTKLEYNKVMRLLQNRAMPVDRAEIREVAVNAYDIDGEQFDTIIDAAVERDLIGQDNGQLVEAN